MVIIDKPGVVAVGVGHLSCLPHVVLQVLGIKMLLIVLEVLKITTLYDGLLIVSKKTLDRKKKNLPLTCQEVEEDRFSTTSLYPVLGPGGCNK